MGQDLVLSDNLFSSVEKTNANQLNKNQSINKQTFKLSDFYLSYKNYN